LIICYIDKLIYNHNTSIVFLITKYHICFPLIGSYNKIISLRADKKYIFFVYILTFKAY